MIYLKKNLSAFCLVTAIVSGMCILTACGDKKDSSVDSDIHATAPADSVEMIGIGNAVAESQGVWSCRNLLIYHASDNKRYVLEESPDGTIRDKNNQTYSFRECDNKLYYIIPAEDSLTVKEGKFAEENVGKKESPDGFKPMVINYRKSDLFDLDALEQAITGKKSGDSENSENPEESGTEQSNSESEILETDADAETKSKPESESESQSGDDADTENTENTTEENAIYAEIYQDIADFMLTDNFRQKDPGNRALELFNHLNNLAHANIERESITNDTAKQEIRFKCYEKYTFTVNVADSEITVSTD